MSLDFDATQTLALATGLLLLGGWLVTRVGLLAAHNIPVPVVGGLLSALVTLLLYGGLDLQLSFDVSLREPLMLGFFTCVGLGADLRSLRQGGSQLAVFVAACLLYLLFQNGLGVLVALSMDLHPAVGLLSSSMTLSGGHGTGAAYAERFSQLDNLTGAMELALACATFGLVIGGLLGGPVAGRLIRRHRLRPRVSAAQAGSQVSPDARPEAPVDALRVTRTLFLVLLCICGGALLKELLAGNPFTLPGFVWSLFCGVLVRNLGSFSGRYAVHRGSLELVAQLSLSLFLAMALMSLRLWELWALAGPMLALLSVQAVGMALFASLITWRMLGRTYDAAVVAGGHCGFGLGATPTAVANMEALTRRHGPAPQAFLIVPLAGAFFIDLANALVIQGFLALPLFG